MSKTRPSPPLRRLAAASLLALACAAPVGAQTLQVGVPENNALALAAQEVMRLAYAKLGITLQAKPLPLRRALQMAERGDLDADLMRAAVTLEGAPSLIRIEVPVGRVVASAYQRGDCPARVTVAELAKKKVSYFRGTRFVELLLPKEALMEANDNWDALRRLQRGLVDYALDVELVSDINLIRHNATNICKIAEPVLTVPLFHAVHQRHAELAPRLQQALQAMQDKGEIAAIWAAVEKQQREEATAQAKAAPPR